MANKPGRLQSATRLGDIACEAAKRQSVERVPGVKTLSKTPPRDRRYCGFIRKLVVKEQEAIEKIEGGGNRQRVGYVPIAGGASPQHKAGADRIAGIALPRRSSMIRAATEPAEPVDETISRRYRAMQAR